MKLHHLALRSSQPHLLAEFYCEIMELPVVRTQPHGVWLGLEDAVLMIEQAGPGEPVVPTGDLALMAFRVDAAEQSAVRARLAARGLPVEAESAYTLYFRDPEGRRVGVSTYPLPELRISPPRRRA